MYYWKSDYFSGTLQTVQVPASVLYFFVDEWIQNGAILLGANIEEWF